MEIILAVFSGFGLALLAPFIHPLIKPYAGWLFALLPLGITFYFIQQIDTIAHENIEVSYEWVPMMGINLDFYVDGLSLIFILMISGIGALIFIYAGGYLDGHPQQGLFFSYLAMFMASMLGVVTATNLLLLFIFWELTSISSYLLIGFNHAEKKSQEAALQALLVTGGGGLALLAGLVMLANIGGSQDITTLMDKKALIQGSNLYVPILLLILAGAFTKSAQFPFHFWLPSAMEAPTPVSAYLHSATMVKAGIYLLARFTPILGGTDEWQTLLAIFGGITMLMGGYLAWQHDDLKRILAYSTISGLGSLVFMLGLGTVLAIKAMLLFLIVHSMYKGGYFLVAGAVDHAAGTRNIQNLGGLWNKMPFIFTGAALATLAMTGLPPTLGFIGKEILYEATLEHEGLTSTALLTAAAVLTNIFVGASAWLILITVFLRKAPEGKEKKKFYKHAHPAPFSLWLGPIVLGSLGILTALSSHYTAENILMPGMESILYGQHLKEPHLAFWHGEVNDMLILSVITVIGGLVVFAGVNYLRPIVKTLDISRHAGPEAFYIVLVDGLRHGSKVFTRFMQNGRLSFYLTVIIFTSIVAISGTLFYQVDTGELWSGELDVIYDYAATIFTLMVLTVLLIRLMLTGKLLIQATNLFIMAGLAILIIAVLTDTYNRNQLTDAFLSYENAGIFKTWIILIILAMVIRSTSKHPLIHAVTEGLILGSGVIFTLGLVFGSIDFDKLVTPIGGVNVRVYEYALAILMIAATFKTIVAASRLEAIASLGIIGYSVSVIYILFGAPDLAMTQFAIETLTVVLFVLVVARLPRMQTHSGPIVRIKDTILAVAMGATVTLTMLAVLALPLDSRLTPYFAEHSYKTAHGENIVNVILVDFRGMDTMVEITVLSIAALGIYALIKGQSGKSTDEQ